MSDETNREPNRRIKLRKRRGISRLVLAAAIGALSAGVIYDVTKFVSLSQQLRRADDEISKLTAEEKEIISDQESVRKDLEKKLENIIGKNPAEEFFFTVGTTSNVIGPNLKVNPKIQKAYDNWVDWQKRFNAEAPKQFPAEFKKLHGLERLYVERLSPRLAVLHHEQGVHRVGQHIFSFERNELGRRAAVTGLGAIVGAGGMTTYRGLRKKRKPVKGPVQRHRGPR